MESIGELESSILEVLKAKEQATTAEILSELQSERSIAYTTVSTTLDRLYKKKLVDRKALVGPGGTRYLFSLGKDEKLKRRIVEATLDRLTGAFGDTAYSAIYKKLESLPEEDIQKFRKQIEGGRRKRSG